MQRLYVNNSLVLGGILRLEGDKAHYLLNVLRMKRDEKLLLFNGSDGEMRGRCIEVSKKHISFELVEQTRVQTTPSKIHYAFAPLKAARLDYMVQKAVEMGVGILTPVLTDYTQLHRLKDDRLMSNAVEAAEQCGILTLPIINNVIKLDEFLKKLTGTLIFCDENAPVASAMQALAGISGEVCVFIGPEGGFSPREREKLLSYPHVIRLSLGKTILRADTAAVAALALVNEALLHRRA